MSLAHSFIPILHTHAPPRGHTHINIPHANTLTSALASTHPPESPPTHTILFSVPWNQCIRFPAPALWSLQLQAPPLGASQADGIRYSLALSECNTALMRSVHVLNAATSTMVSGAGSGMP